MAPARAGGGAVTRGRRRSGRSTAGGPAVRGVRLARGGGHGQPRRHRRRDVPQPRQHRRCFSPGPGAALHHVGARLGAGPGFRPLRGPHRRRDRDPRQPHHLGRNEHRDGLAQLLASADARRRDGHGERGGDSMDVAAGVCGGERGTVIDQRARPMTLPGRSAARTTPPSPEASVLSRFSPWDALLPAAAILWIVAVRQVRVGDINDFGLVPALPITFFASLALITASFVMALGRGKVSTLRLSLHIVAVIFALQAVAPVVFPLPQYGYVYKHFGVVEYIGLHGSVNDHVDIYQNWPGFFALGAWLDRLAGESSPTPYAAWAPVYFNLIAVLAINLSLRALSIPPRARWLALYIFVAANWVGQDYYAPQAFAFVLSQSVLACLLTMFRAAPAPWIGRLEERVTNFARGVYVKTAPLVTPQLTRFQRMAALLAVFVTFAVITFSHQLSPY